MVITRSSSDNHHDRHSRNQRKQGGGAERDIHHHDGHPHRVEPVVGQWCWHCCHELGDKDVPVSIPQRMVGDRFETFGYFCSLSCAKAYILEHPTFDSRRQLLYLNKVATEIYGVRPPIVQAPPRLCLKRFGGDLDIEEFRRVGGGRVVHTCEVPPFSRILARYDERPVPGRRLNNVPDAIEMTRAPPPPPPPPPMQEEEEERPRRQASGRGLGRFMVS